MCLASNCTFELFAPIVVCDLFVLVCDCLFILIFYCILIDYIDARLKIFYIFAIKPTKQIHLVSIAKRQIRAISV